MLEQRDSIDRSAIEDLIYEDKAKKEKMLLFIDKDNEENMIPIFPSMGKEISNIFHKKKEIKPFDDWDIFKFMNFISYMPEDFVATKVERSKEKGFNRSMNVYWKNHHIFKILMTNGLEKQNVFLISWCKWIQIDERNNYYVQKHIGCSLDDIHSYSHPLAVLGKCFWRLDMTPCTLLNGIFKNAFKRQGYNHEHAISSWESLIELSKSLPGLVKITEQEYVSKGFPTSSGKCLQSFIWVCTHTQHTSTSFRCALRFARCVGLAPSRSGQVLLLKKQKHKKLIFRLRSLKGRFILQSCKIQKHYKFKPFH